MKSMSNERNNCQNDIWLGFSLSSQMEASSNRHQTHSCSNTVSNAIPSSFSSSFNYPGIYHGEKTGFYSPLTVMPLKSDGSLCIIEGNRTQPQGMVTSTPKVADFFGGATMGTHHYDGCDRGCMALSLDNGQDFLNSLQENSRQQQIPLEINFHSSSIHSLYLRYCARELCLSLSVKL